MCDAIKEIINKRKRKKIKDHIKWHEEMRRKFPHLTHTVNVAPKREEKMQKRGESEKKRIRKRNEEEMK